MKRAMLAIASFLVSVQLLSVATTVLATDFPDYQPEVVVKISDLEVNKRVFDPERGRFVDNLDVTDHKFVPGDEITFQIIIKNVGEVDFEKIRVEDSLPDFLRPVDKDDLDFEIHDLNPGEEAVTEIKAKVKDEKHLPKDQSVICGFNVAKVKTEKQEGKDVAKVCITKKVAVIKVLPVTGPEKLPLVLSLSLVGGLAGVALVVLNRQ